MVKIRKGNQISVNWLIDFKNTENISLSDMSLEVFLVSPLKKKIQVTGFTVSGSVISFTLEGNKQCSMDCGKYSLLLVADRCQPTQMILDKCDVFILLDRLDGKIQSGETGTDKISVETVNVISEAVTGSVSVDLTRYYTKSEIDAMFAGINNEREEEASAGNRPLGRYSHTFGRGLVTYNVSETAVGQYNFSSYSASPFPDSFQTVFSVGCGTSNNFRKNAIEVRQDGRVLLRAGDEMVVIEDIIRIDYENGERKIKFIGQATESDTSGLVSHDELAGMDLAKQQWVTQQIIDYITSGQVNMELYVSKEELGAYNFAYHTELLELGSYMTSYYVQKPELDSYATQEWVEGQDYMTRSEGNNLVTQEWLDSQQYLGIADLGSMGYITEASLPDLSPYITSTYITTYYYDKNQVNSLVLDQIRDNFIEKDLIFKGSPAYTITISDIEKWNTPVNLLSYATKEFVSQSINAIPPTDLSQYVTKELLSRAGYITSHQSLEGYATETYVLTKINAIPAPDLSNYVSYTYLEERLGNIVTDETDPVFSASPAAGITNENMAVMNKLQYSNAFKKLEFNSENDALDGFLATENYVLDQISQNSNIVIKLTRSQFDFLTEQGLVDEHKIYMITDEDDEVVHENDLDSYATKVYVGAQLGNYYTKPEVQALIANLQPGEGGTIDLTGYATESWVQEYITSLNMASKAYAQSQAASALQSAKDYADTISTQGIDLTGYATKSYLNSKLANYATLSDLPETSGFASRTWVNTNFASKSDLQDIDWHNMDLSGIATKQDINSAGYITSGALEGYATEAYVNSKIAAATGTDLSDYVTKEEINSAGYITSHQSLAGYATEAYVNSKIASLDIPVQPDMSNYATKAYVQGKIDSITIPDPDLSEYATKTYVTNKVNSINVPDMDIYATKTYVTAKMSEVQGNANIVWTGTQAQYNSLQDKTIYQIYLIKQ